MAEEENQEEGKEDEDVKKMTVDTHFQTLNVETESGKKFLVELTPTE